MRVSLNLGNHECSMAWRTITGTAHTLSSPCTKTLVDWCECWHCIWALPLFIFSCLCIEWQVCSIVGWIRNQATGCFWALWLITQCRMSCTWLCWRSLLFNRKKICEYNNHTAIPVTHSETAIAIQPFLQDKKNGCIDKDKCRALLILHMNTEQWQENLVQALPEVALCYT